MRNSSLTTPPLAPGLEDLAAAVRTVVSWQADETQTVQAVAEELRHCLPSPAILTAKQRTGDPKKYCTHLLYAEPDGCFSILALVWLPGQTTPIHDHVAWCAFGVIHGAEYEELFKLDEKRKRLIKVNTNKNLVGEVSGLAPPGDIHRVHNTGDQTAISIHIYGADLSGGKSSINRRYDLPVYSG